MDLSHGILLATSNKGKLNEIKQILGNMANIKFYTLSDVKSETFDVEENGSTFRENAFIKAKAYAEKFGFVTLADDSGLEIDYLKGAPGVKSARYAGIGAKDSDLYNKVLKELKDVVPEQRTARFKCSICLYDPKDSSSIFSEGTCEGAIATKPSGENGFGYDPIFIPFGYEPKTIAELESEIKNSISHRGRALLALKSKLLLG